MIFFLREGLLINFFPLKWPYIGYNLNEFNWVGKEIGMSEKFTISRKELYREVWATPITRLAKKYGETGSD